MNRHNDIKQSSLFQFSGPEGIGRDNFTTNDPSVLTSYSNRLKSSECASHKEVNPFSPDIPIRKPIPNSDIEDDRDPTDEPYLPDDPGDEPE